MPFMRYEYTGTSKAKGRFVIKTKGFKKGAVVTVSASDKYKGKTRTSAKTKVRVGSQTQYSNAAGSGKISVSKIRSTSRVVKGKIALKTGYSNSPDYPRLHIRDEYLDKCGIK